MTGKVVSSEQEHLFYIRGRQLVQADRVNSGGVLRRWVYIRQQGSIGGGGSIVTAARSQASDEDSRRYITTCAKSKNST
ncbi:hypothetical protein O0I10_012495 [Lichtheimia ornata]|uniref:Uncharacterized protein n=1 Tax=Lichtheimia ornata TaxID=688661 RepID=A0AAD7UQZ6_9FUNG|nr:uncharacterized protein O0I10_012495 [Lichtheimia ornata]KAJ8651924.1 hypothetical protein O0I10_012495 [Lichtheimia ornata]